MCLSVGFARGGRGYHTMMREGPYIGYRKYRHSDRWSYDSKAESMTQHLPKICQNHQLSALAPAQRVTDSDVNILQIRRKTYVIKKLYLHY
jgi:hypothetical protein